jgi:hypothetical protein
MANFSYIFTPGISSVVYLPINGEGPKFTATLLPGISGAVSLSACYDSYGVLWKWSSFETGNSAVPGTSFTGLCALTAIAVSTNITAPSSWDTTESIRLTSGPGIYTKKWINEGPLSADLFNKSLGCIVSGGLQWTLSSDTNWPNIMPYIIPLSVSDSFEFDLKYKNYGTENGTVSRFKDTNLTLNVKLTSYCLSSNSNLIPNFVNETFNFKVMVPPIISIYTPNRYVPINSAVNFQNLITFTDRISCLEIDFDDNKKIRLYENEINIPYFTETYDVVGSKSLTFTAYLYNYVNPHIVRFPSIIEVVSEYDTVDPSKYRDVNEPINLPWPNQPKVGANDWIVADNINSCINKFIDNLNYLETRGHYYTTTFSDYFGYLGRTFNGVLSGCDFWTWEDLDPLTSSLNYTATWRDVFFAGTDSLDNGKYVDCGFWTTHDCISAYDNPKCLGLYCVNWNWRDRNNFYNTDNINITWKDTKLGEPYEKRWKFEPCTDEFKFELCLPGNWNVNIPELNSYYPDIQTNRVQNRCLYTGIASRNNNFFLSLKTEVRIIPNNYNSIYSNILTTIDGVLNFANIENICLDSANRIYILDSVLSRVAGFSYNQNNLKEPFDLQVTWGGFGSGADKTAFSSPRDIHMDQLDNIWIADTGNLCVKHYTKGGVWLNTIFDNAFTNNAPISICVDSQRNLHVLTNNEIRVYDYAGNFLFNYNYKKFSSDTPQKINTSYNREIIYVVFSSQVLKFFRNGIHAGYIISEQTNVNNMVSLYHDEFRNLLIINDDKIIKYCDLMTVKSVKGSSPFNYWSNNDLYIHKEEYIQNWVYTKSFERLWDNIEMFRNSLQFTELGCRQYIPPVYSKDKVTIGQNEIVTASTINRVLEYLWSNLQTIVTYFDPSCNKF